MDLVSVYTSDQKLIVSLGKNEFVEMWLSLLRNLNTEPVTKAAAKFIDPNLTEGLSEASVVTELESY